MDNDLRVHQFDDVDLEGVTVIDGFPSVGLVSTIAANYLIDVLELEQVGIVDSAYFPTVSIVRDSDPMYPVRLYAGDEIAVFISEFQPAPQLIRYIADTILSWARKNEAELVVSPEGLVIESEDGGEDRDLVTYGLGSTDWTNDMLEKREIPPFEMGIITGVSGVLLNEGHRKEINVISLLAEAHPNYPDARAAAKVIEAIDALVDRIDIDVEPLFSEAENIETTLKTMQSQAQAQTGPKTEPGGGPQLYG